MKVYVLIEENSPELAAECGEYNIKAVFGDWNKAKTAALELANSYCKPDDNCDDKINEFEIIDRLDNELKGSRIGYTLYHYGNEDSPLWFSIIVEPAEWND